MVSTYLAAITRAAGQVAAITRAAGQVAAHTVTVAAITRAAGQVVAHTVVSWHVHQYTSTTTPENAAETTATTPTAPHVLTPSMLAAEAKQHTVPYIQSPTKPCG